MLAVLSARELPLEALLLAPGARAGLARSGAAGSNHRDVVVALGVGWYYEKQALAPPRAALYRTPAPPFLDPNLRDVCAATFSRGIIAHAVPATAAAVAARSNNATRAATATPLLRAGRLLFCFRGGAPGGGFRRIRRACAAAASDEAFEAAVAGAGASDGELLFALLLTHLQQLIGDDESDAGDDAAEPGSPMSLAVALAPRGGSDDDDDAEEEDRAAALYGLDQPLLATHTPDVPLRGNGGLQTIFSGGDALSVAAGGRSHTNIFVEGFREGVANPYGRAHGLREGDIVIGLNGMTMLGKDFSHFTEAMQAAADVVGTASFDLYRHSGSAVLRTPPPALAGGGGDDDEQDPAAGLHSIHAELEPNAVVVVPMADSDATSLDTIFHGGFPWRVRPPGRQVRPNVNIFVESFSQREKPSFGRECGLRAGDIVVKVNNTNVLGQEMEKFVDVLKVCVRSRTDITLAVFRPDDELRATFTSHGDHDFGAGDDDTDGAVSPPPPDDSSGFVPHTPPLTAELLAELTASGGGVPSRRAGSGASFLSSGSADGAGAVAAALGVGGGAAGGGEGGGGPASTLPSSAPRRLRRMRSSSSVTSPLPPGGGGGGGGGDGDGERAAQRRRGRFEARNLVRALAATVQQVDGLLRCHSGSGDAGEADGFAGTCCLTDGHTVVVSRHGRGHPPAGAPAPPAMFFTFGPAGRVEQDLEAAASVPTCGGDADVGGGDCDDAFPGGTRHLRSGSEGSGAGGGSGQRSGSDGGGAVVAAAAPPQRQQQQEKKVKKRFKVRNPFKKRNKGKGDGGAAAAECAAAGTITEKDEVAAAAAVLQAEAGGGVLQLDFAGIAPDTTTHAGDAAFMAAERPLTTRTQWFAVAADSVVWCTRESVPHARTVASAVRAGAF